MAAGGWASKSCKNSFGERVGRATNYAHGNGRPYQTRQATLRPIVFRQLATEARAPGSNSKHCGSDWLLRKLLTPCSGRLQWYHLCLSWRLFMPVPLFTYFRQPLLQFLCPKISRGWFCRRSTRLLAASSDSNLGEVYIIGFRKVCSLLWYKI